MAPIVEKLASRSRVLSPHKGGDAVACAAIPGIKIRIMILETKGITKIIMMVRWASVMV